MPRSKLFLCSGVCLLIAIAGTAQVLPKHPTAQQTIGYQMYQQKKWNVKQLPANSVLYRHYSNSLNFPVANRFKPIRTNWISFPAINLHSHTDKTGLPYNYSSQFSDLQSYLEMKRKQNVQWQKQSWWKDPSKGTGALLLKDILSNSRGFIQQ